MPAIYGNACKIVRGQSYVAITYGLVHEVRVIPAGAGAPSADHPDGRRARGHSGRHTIVETTNFSDKIAYRGSSEHLRLVERFTRTGPDSVEWSSTFDDPHTWATPWTFAMRLSQNDDSQRPFEYACHEGNYAMSHLLAAARAEENDVKNGVVRAAGPTGADEQER